MGKVETLKKMINLADYLDSAGDHRQANLIDYFIKKFADNDPTKLAEVFQDIPDEEKPDLILAIKEAKSREDSIMSPNMQEDQTDLLLKDIYEDVRGSAFDPNKVVDVKNYGDVTLGEIFTDLGIIE